MWKFSLTKGRDGQHSLSYRYMRIGILYALIPHIYPSVGYCVVYLGQGLSTTFFVYTLINLGSCGFNRNYEEVFTRRLFIVRCWYY